MESVSNATPALFQYSPQQSTYETNSLILNATLSSSSQSSDASSLDIDYLSQGLSLTGKEILAKINELLKDKVPQGVESLNPEDFTAEKTAATIVDSITSLFSSYQKSNPTLAADQALERFMAAARSGVDQGYSSAYDTLEGLGAFSFEGVKSGIEQTKILIESKLSAFETAQKKALGVDTVQQPAATSTSNALLTQAGLSLVV